MEKQFIMWKFEIPNNLLVVVGIWVGGILTRCASFLPISRLIWHCILSPRRNGHFSPKRRFVRHFIFLPVASLNFKSQFFFSYALGLNDCSWYGSWYGTSTIDHFSASYMPKWATSVILRLHRSLTTAVESVHCCVLFYGVDLFASPDAIEPQ